MWFLEEYMIYVCIGLLFVALIVALMCLPKRSLKTREIAIAATCIAMSFGLSYIKVPIGLNGGSVTMGAIIPLAVYSYFSGIRKGLLAALCYSILQMFQSFWFASFMQILVDYILAFTVFGLVAALKKLRTKLKGYDFVIMLLVCYLGRYFCSFLVGALPWLDGIEGVFLSGWGVGIVGSLIYQANYLVVDCLIALAIAAVLVQSGALVRIEKVYTPPEVIMNNAEN